MEDKMSEETKKEFQEMIDKANKDPNNKLPYSLNEIFEALTANANYKIANRSILAMDKKRKAKADRKKAKKHKKRNK